MSNNPYPVDSPSWREWEKQAGRLLSEPLPILCYYIPGSTFGDGCRCINCKERRKKK